MDGSGWQGIHDLLTNNGPERVSLNSTYCARRKEMP
jgi:hypothetical protein